MNFFGWRENGWLFQTKNPSVPPPTVGMKDTTNLRGSPCSSTVSRALVPILTLARL